MTNFLRGLWDEICIWIISDNAEQREWHRQLARLHEEHERRERVEQEERWRIEERERERLRRKYRNI